LRQRFAAELAHGQRFQQEYQQYEARKIASGVPITDESFFDEFYAGRAPIASASGSEEWFAFVSPQRISHYTQQRAQGRGLFWGGAAALALALCMRFVARRRSRS
jgi:hypothetical protein